MPITLHALNNDVAGIMLLNLDVA